MSEIFTMREVTALLKINEKTAYKLAAKGEIPGFKVGGSWRFDSGEIDNWIKRELITNHFQSIEKFESELWKIAYDLRANSGLASNEYFMPIMGLIFLRHATNRFYEARAAIEADKAAGRMPDQPADRGGFCASPRTHASRGRAL